MRVDCVAEVFTAFHGQSEGAAGVAYNILGVEHAAR